MKAIVATTLNALVNVNNFLCMRQQKAVARHYNFNSPMGQTSYTDKMVIHTPVQGLEVAAIGKTSWRNMPQMTTSKTNSPQEN